MLGISVRPLLRVLGSDGLLVFYRFTEFRSDALALFGEAGISLSLSLSLSLCCAVYECLEFFFPTVFVLIEI